ncbi:MULTISPECIES: AAA family ATPase [Dietzia]|uniref:AAA family ATPase n=1 Tax=Dietzia cinnamea TaxID=321318 RepID=A0AAW5Q5F6_9ACTN|nr:MULTISPECIES: AAA family ATPase [Dietzia]PWD96200.1 AAA family ATPase [Dietzia maris]MCT1862700.1 AAA family ATPase [Dietzia cinnamea]MCT2029360.1 AAA family ATPase [Dietzia cinnamea]MCT2032606.1 AAA family ATPase [Dietzia cinnamea]MCT2060229.1 AAA family ATPase [Dietzia cinnamea]
MAEFWGIHNDQTTIDPVSDGAVRIGWDEVGDLRKIQPTRDAFKEALSAANSDSSSSIAAWAGTLFRFIHVLKVGDVIVCPDRSTRALNIGRVSGDYEFRADSQMYSHWRPVEWLVTGVSRDELSLPAQNEMSAATTLFTLVTGREEIEQLLSDPPPAESRATFEWGPFYEELANAVLSYRSDREVLLDKLWKVARNSGLEHLFKYLRTDTRSDGTRGALRDIDPFTVFSPFNRGIKESARAQIAQAFKDEFGISAKAPAEFSGIPIVNNLNSWFIRWENERDPDQVDFLWDLAESAVGYASASTEESRESLVAAFDAAAQGNTRQLSMGLYWIRPNVFTAFDQVNASFLADQFPDLAQRLDLRAKIDGEAFLANTEEIQAWFEDATSPFSSIPELSFAAWQYVNTASPSAADEGAIDETPSTSPDTGGLLGDIFTVDSIIEDASFVPRHELEAMRERLLVKKNLILQGPPGTGKTWLARRLAWTLCNERGSSRTTVLQFHPSMSYEDFVRGYRPTVKGGLELADGPFLEMCTTAQDNPDHKYVMVIEEINRGNPAQIFGELLTLLETDKRTSEYAMRLSYPRAEDERFFVPPNVFVIGTMNVADRSLALVDMALRRRFAFVELSPQFGNDWAQHVSGLGYDLGTLERFGARMEELNSHIAADRSLGRQFCIGHSFVTPSVDIRRGGLDTRQWIERVVDTEIGPLLEEYWFDRPEEVSKHTAALLDP